ncbi:MAG: DUF899 domain-containing protein [Alphaproteobacteria bacterium]|jgi:predicted dithiol-disulfide oxidoreductase (DUF899 family)
MTHHPVVATREEWIAARKALLTAEKDHTKMGDRLARMRQDLPWVRIDRDYRFQSANGPVGFSDLFEGRSQLLVQHFMFGPDFSAGCPSCSSIADGVEGSVVHLNAHDVTFAAVSRAPIETLLGYRDRMGWSFPWYSSGDDTFNFDFNVSFTEEEQRDGQVDYNYRLGGHAMDLRPIPGPVEQAAADCGTDGLTFGRDRPGISAFIRRDGVIYHTYSAYSRGVDGVWGVYAWLDRAPLGRNETGPWMRRNDEY